MCASCSTGTRGRRAQILEVPYCQTRSVFDANLDISYKRSLPIHCACYHANYNSVSSSPLMSRNLTVFEASLCRSVSANCRLTKYNSLLIAANFSRSLLFCSCNDRNSPLGNGQLPSERHDKANLLLAFCLQPLTTYNFLSHTFLGLYETLFCICSYSYDLQTFRTLTNI